MKASGKQTYFCWALRLSTESSKTGLLNEILSIWLLRKRKKPCLMLSAPQPPTPSMTPEATSITNSVFFEWPSLRLPTSSVRPSVVVSRMLPSWPPPPLPQSESESMKTPSEYFHSKLS